MLKFRKKILFCIFSKLLYLTLCLKPIILHIFHSFSMVFYYIFSEHIFVNKIIKKSFPPLPCYPFLFTLTRYQDMSMLSPYYPRLNQCRKRQYSIKGVYNNFQHFGNRENKIFGSFISPFSII